MHLFFDTETTGLASDWNAPVTDVDNWPRIVQLAYLIVDHDCKIIKKQDFIIRPEGFSIPESSSRVHGITQQKAEREGIYISEALKNLDDDLIKYNISILVAHNLEFDRNVLNAEFLRLLGRYPDLSVMYGICTMKTTASICKIPSGSYSDYKYPKLNELYYTLFKSNFVEQHNAVADVMATYACFKLLRTVGMYFNIRPYEVLDKMPLSRIQEELGTLINSFKEQYQQGGTLIELSQRLFEYLINALRYLLEIHYRSRDQGGKNSLASIEAYKALTFPIKNVVFSNFLHGRKKMTLNLDGCPYGDTFYDVSILLMEKIRDIPVGDASSYQSEVKEIALIHENLITGKREDTTKRWSLWG